MAEKKSKKGLGRGLSALLSETAPVSKSAPAGNAANPVKADATKDAATDGAKEAAPVAAPVAVSASAAAPQASAIDNKIAIELVAPNPDQPRRHFNEDRLAELANSIIDKGVLQPILVRPKAGPQGEKYQIVAGERRWRAAQIAQLDEIPIIIRELSDQETQEIALIENIQRTDLSAIEEAQGYRGLIDRFSYTQQDVADIIGKSRAHIANTLRLLDLPPKIQELVDHKNLSAGHARALIGTPDPYTLASLIINEGMTVREAERRAQALKLKQGGDKRPRKGDAAHKDADTVALERDLTAHLGLKVTVNFKGEAKGGSVEIDYKTLEQLDGLIAKLMD
ncbi:MAG: ParB/RepB/Spo0J family partition protein [Alphaproteobacteria bacterium]